MSRIPGMHLFIVDVECGKVRRFLAEAPRETISDYYHFPLVEVGNTETDSPRRLKLYVIDSTEEMLVEVNDAGETLHLDCVSRYREDGSYGAEIFATFDLEAAKMVLDAYLYGVAQGKKDVAQKLHDFVMSA